MPKSKKFWQFQAKKDAEKVGELLLYGPISSTSWWGDEVTPKQFKKDLDALGDIDTLNVYINSGGGDVFAGQAIHSMLKRHKSQVNVYVDGLAASIASVIAMAGDTVYMPRNAMMMIHKAWTWGAGNADEFRKLADDLDKIGESIVATYEGKTGMEKDKILELMSAETWMTAEEALEYGFVDEIEGEKKVAASVSGNFLVTNGVKVDLSKYSNFSPDKFIFVAAVKNAPMAMEPTEETCICSGCSHGDNCQAAGAKCCICGNCEMATKCSKPGSGECKCKDCSMAQANCCQPGADSCMCDTCPNMDCKKGHMETESQANASVKPAPAPKGTQQELVDLYAKLNLNNRRRTDV